MASSHLTARPVIVGQRGAAALAPDNTIACAREITTLGGLRAAHPLLRRAWSLKRARHAAAAHLAPVRGEVADAAGAAVRQSPRTRRR